MPSRTGPKKSRCGSRGRASESGISYAALAAKIVEPTSTAKIAGRERRNATARIGISAKKSIGSHSRQETPIPSRRSHDTVTSTATRATRTTRLANGRFQLGGAQARGEVVTAAQHDDGHAGALDAQDQRRRLGREPALGARRGSGG